MVQHSVQCAREPFFWRKQVCWMGEQLRHIGLTQKKWNADFRRSRLRHKSCSSTMVTFSLPGELWRGSIWAFDGLRS